VTRLFGRRDGAGRESEAVELRVAAERATVLIEESREIVVVLDERRNVLAASRRARETDGRRSRSRTRSTAGARPCST